jgi:HD superfamily phosphodiesterase
MDDRKNNWQKWIPLLEKELEVEIQKAPSPSEAHGKDHIFRVLRRCIVLEKRLDADLEVLFAAAYLHDLGWHYLEEAGLHGELGAQKAEPVLERISFPTGKRSAVLRAIAVHDTGIPPEDRTTLESKILYDADKLDMFGVIGIFRYLRRVYGKWSIDDILNNLKTRWEGLSFAETRELALKDFEYVRDYFMRLKNELEEDGLR